MLGRLLFCIGINCLDSKSLRYSFDLLSVASYVLSVSITLMSFIAEFLLQSIIIT